MSRLKCLGIWMDHASANLMEYNDEMETKRILAETADKPFSSTEVRGESQQNNKEQNMLTSYYNKLGEIIKNYEAVVLFGPTNAKTELYNLLQASIQFNNIKIEVKEADKMTENQQHAFVKEYFSKN